ncbi:hypothetical protein [Bosea sp. NBC_00550]|uniref:hypothetical protein n=1 Tax=Bosea sp. NBC_00550 TaxID=2969621 RepID=UPI002230B4E0|nr:hypothetical protein [Bosea sp. NBC_00550]UZF91227.1 hypothetical protein NWE53_19145 [Bosea sp. NBC_00550]
MIAQEDIQEAVTQGIIDQAQAVRIVHLARLRQVAQPAVEAESVDPDDEHFRLIGGFNDVFVGIGVALLAGALIGLSRVLGFGKAFALTAALAAWGLSEIFARRMRLALPSILLAVMFAGSAGVFASILGGPQSFSSGSFRAESSYSTFAFAGFGLAAALHYWRFRVSIDPALAAIGALGAIVAALFILAPDFMHSFANAIFVAGGLTIFAVALKLDMADPNRRTRHSDAALWLHLLAAGLIVHPIFRAIAFTGRLGSAEAALILCLFVILGIVALVIDRRALLVSGLSYAGIALGYLITRNVSDSLGLPLALLGLAVLVLALSAGWRRLRGTILPHLPLGSLRERLPPVALPQ